jgi:hypothetical protein
MTGRISRKDFLDALFAQYFRDNTGFIIVQTVKRLDPRTSTRYFPTIDTLVKEQYARDQNVYFGVSPRERMKPGTENVRYLTSLWCGLDLSPEGHSGRDAHFVSPAYAAKAVRSFPLPPSIIVESGWGLHLYWLLKKAVEISDHQVLEDLLTNINVYFNCKTRITLDSTLRLPGTLNCKMPGQFLDCNVKYLNTSFRYDLQDFESIDLSSREASDRLGRSGTSFIPPGVDDALADAPISISEDQADELAVEVLEEYAEKDGLSSVSTFVEATAEEGGGGPPQRGQLSEELVELLADRIAAKLVDKMSGKIADQVAGRILARMSAVRGSGNRTS